MLKRSGSYLKTCAVSSPNAFVIFFAVTGPTPFIEPFAKELPMEYAVELNNLIKLEMEGSLG